MAKKSITIDELAVMVQKGFAGNDKRFDETVTKEELKSLKNEIVKRFDRLEKVLVAGHEKRIEHLEHEVKELRELFAM